MVYLGAVAVVAALFVAFAALRTPRPTDLASQNLRGGRRVTSVREINLERGTAERLLTPFVDFVAHRARKLAGHGATDRTRRQLQLAGLAGRYRAEQVTAIRMLLVAVAALVGAAWFLSRPSTSSLFGAVLLVGVVALVPRAVLARRGEARQQEMLVALPDVIDQITISVEAGLGFDSAVARAIRGSRGPLAQELSRVLGDIQMGRTRAQALDALLHRTDIPDLRQFVQAIRQAERYGVPILSILRVQADDLRERRKARAEERAMRAPVRIVFPLVLCVLPGIFVVVLGPAAMRMFDSL